MRTTVESDGPLMNNNAKKHSYEEIEVVELDRQRTKLGKRQ